MWNDSAEHWCEHKPSVTINVREKSGWKSERGCIKHFDTVSGVSFLPYDGGTYRQAPYTEINEDEYNKWVEKMPKESTGCNSRSSRRKTLQPDRKSWPARLVDAKSKENKYEL
jgi:hypothetical protein